VGQNIIADSNFLPRTNNVGGSAQKSYDTVVTVDEVSNHVDALGFGNGGGGVCLTTDSNGIIIIHKR